MKVSSYLLAVFLITILIGCTSEEEKIAQTFDGVRQASNKANASLQIGVSYYDFGKYLTEVLSEFKQINVNEISPKGRNLYNHYASYIGVTNDMHKLWKLKVETPSKYKEFPYMMIDIYLGFTLPAVVQKYDLHYLEFEGDYFITTRRGILMFEHGLDKLIRLSIEQHEKIEEEFKKITVK